MLEKYIHITKGDVIVMKCIACGGEAKQTDPRSWCCLDCGAELYKSDDSEVSVVGYKDSDERLSVWDAADIYLSRGFDEDYQFGYTHEELMQALDD